MPDGTHDLPKFDDLRSALKYDFDAVQQQIDPFRRLAWLVERHEAILQQRGGKSHLASMLGLQDAAALLQNCEHLLRNYHEIRCDPDFPRQLIQKGLTPKTRQTFIDVWGEVTRGEDDYGIDLDDDQILETIERWLGFRQAALTVERPVSGLTTALIMLNQGHNRLGDPGLNRGDVLGQVTNAFLQGETLLRQLLSFYGRVFYGPSYVDVILQQYDQETAEKAQLMAGVASLPELGSELGELLALPEAERPEAVRTFLESLLRGIRKIKFPATEASKLRDLQEGGKGLGFLGYIQVLHSLDRWVFQACESPRSDEERKRGQNFEWIFQRRRLFPSQVEAGSTIDATVKEGNRIKLKTVPIEEQDASPFIEILRRLNRVRPLYVHEADPHFVHPANFENLREGADKILTTFVKLWTDAQEAIFPSVVVVRRLLQIEPNLVRLDYVPESGPPLKYIRVVTTDLPSYAAGLLGQEAYLYTRRDEESTVVLVLHPVDE